MSLCSLFTVACGGLEMDHVIDSPEEAAEVASQDLVNDAIIEMGKRYLGTPYRLRGCDAYGDNTPLDCDQFTWTVFHRLGRNIGCWTNQMDAGNRVALSDKRRGDILFFKNNSGNLYHVGLYAGDGRILHASSYYDKVVISELRYVEGLFMARRVN